MGNLYLYLHFPHMGFSGAQNPRASRALEHITRAAQADTDGTGQAHADLRLSIGNWHLR